MNRSLFFLLVLVVCVGCQQEDEKVSDAPADEQWESLFDGKALDQWRDFQGESVSEKSWAIEDECIVSLSEPGDIVTREKYTDFDLRFEWKVTDAANSGVFFRVSEDESWLHHSGLEYQVLDNVGQAGRPSSEQAGACYGVFGPDEDVTNPASQWNTGRIVVDGDQVEHYVNGQSVLSYQIGSDEYQAKVASGPLKDHDGLAKQASGHIALQNYHGHKVYFRNIRILRLDDNE